MSVCKQTGVHCSSVSSILSAVFATCPAQSHAGQNIADRQHVMASTLMCCDCHPILEYLHHCALNQHIQRWHSLRLHSSSPCVVQSYVKELGQCLLQLETRADEQVTKRLTQLINECQDHLNGTYEGLHPALAKAIAGGNLEQALATVAQLDHSFWRSILVSQSFLSILAFLSSGVFLTYLGSPV